MSIASEIYVNLKTDRILELIEIEEFNKYTFIDVKEFAIAGSNVVSIIPSDGKLIEYYNSWTLRANNEGTYNLDMLIKKDEEEHFFVESLIFLIENFFEPRGIRLNGYFNGYENIFGFTFKYLINNNIISIDFLNSGYKINIDEILEENFKRIGI
jgi:hypothetical protein